MAEYELPSLAESHEVETVEQTWIDEQISDLRYRVAKKLPPKEEETIDNFLRSSWLLRYSSNWIDNTADYVIHLRPDLLYIDNWGKQAFSRRTAIGLRKSLVGLSSPSWGYQPNDRFAVVDYKHSPLYFRRLEVLEDFVESGRRFAPELFLRFAFRGAPHYADLPYRAARVRIDGQVKTEKFDKKYYFSEK